MRVAVLALLAGCRSIIGIDDVGVDEDLANDEDGDGILDHRDNCPLDDNAGQGDADDDGVGDACDPDEVAANRIAFFSPILAETGLDLGPTTAVANGFAALRGAQIALSTRQTPARIVADVRFRTFGASQTLTLEHDAGADGVWQCFVGFQIGGCGGVDCVRFQVSTAALGSAIFEDAEMLARITIDLGAGGPATCTAASTNGVTRMLSSIGPGKALGTITVSATGDAELHGIAVYE